MLPTNSTLVEGVGVEPLRKFPKLACTRYTSPSISNDFIYETVCNLFSYLVYILYTKFYKKSNIYCAAAIEHTYTLKIYIPRN